LIELSDKIDATVEMVSQSIWRQLGID
jgi:hypothetical protein